MGMMTGQMTMAEMLSAGMTPNGILLNQGGVDGVGGGINPLLTKGGQGAPGGGTWVPFGQPAQPNTQAPAGAPASAPGGTFQSGGYSPKTVTTAGHLMQPIGSYGGTPPEGSSKANFLAGLDGNPTRANPGGSNTASGGLAGQQQQTSYLKKLADIVKAPKRTGVGETNQSDIPQQ